VFINVHEMVQTPQGVMYKPSGMSIRLQSLDQCNRIWENAVKPPLGNLFLEPSGGITDRELALVPELVEVNGRIGIDLNQLPNEMIQSGTKVVQALPYDDTQHHVGRRESSVKGYHVGVIRIDAFLANETAFTVMPREISSYRCRMLFCPDDFMEDALQRIRFHGKEKHSEDPEGPRNTNPET
jgi:hypothetical protein